MAIKKDGSVIIDTRMDTRGFNTGAKNMQKSISGLSGAIGKLGVAIGLAFSARAVINFGKECINLGSDLQEVQNVVDVTFGNMSERINEFAKNAITQFGLSELAAKQYASTMGAMLKSMGFNQADVLEMSTTLAGLAGDIASFYNLTGDEAFTKIRSGISGETEPLKQLGINLSVANLEAFALAQGLTKSYNAMTEHEKAMLRYQYLLKTTADAQGDFARTSDSWANQTRILAEQFNSLKATIGQGLINAFTPVIKVLNTLLAKLQTVANAFKALTEQIFGKRATQQASSNLSAIEDEYSDIADATNDAKKAQDKYLTGLDEIKTFQTQDAVGAVDVGGGATDIGITEEIANDAGEIDDILGKIEERFPRLMKFLKDAGAKLKEIVQDIKLGDFEELGKDISELAVLILDFISESIDLVDWESIGEKIGDFLAGINWIEVVKSAFKLKFNIWKAIAEVWFGSFQAAPIETSIMTALAALKFSGLGALLANNLKTALLAALPSSVKDVFMGFASWIPHVAILGAIVAVANEIKEVMQSAFDTSGWTIGDWIKNTLDVVWSTIYMQLDMWRVQLEVWWQDTWLYNELWELGEWWNTYIAPWFTKEKWTELYNNVKNATNSFKSGFSSIWNGIVTRIKYYINQLIGGINSMISGTTNGINGMIKALNALKFDVPDWVPLIGGKKFSLNISTVSAPQIPYLASGAVIPPNAPFMAVLGDQKHGTNIEAPEDLLRKVVREESCRSNGNGATYHFVAQLNGQTLFEQFVSQAQLNQMATGQNVLVTL